MTAELHHERTLRGGGTEVANGFYVFSANYRNEAVKVTSMIPASTLQQLAGVSVLYTQPNDQTGQRLSSGV